MMHAIIIKMQVCAHLLISQEGRPLDALRNLSCLSPIEGASTEKYLPGVGRWVPDDLELQVFSPLFLKVVEMREPKTGQGHFKQAQNQVHSNYISNYTVHNVHNNSTHRFH